MVQIKTVYVHSFAVTKIQFIFSFVHNKYLNIVNALSCRLNLLIFKTIN